MPRNSSICEVMWFLKSHDGKRMRADAYHSMKLPGAGESWFQRKIRQSHKITPDQGYEIKYIGNGNFRVTGGQNEYILEENHFSLCMKEACAYFCLQCGRDGLCFHSYTCSCPRFSGRNAKAILLII